MKAPGYYQSKIGMSPGSTDVNSGSSLTRWFL